MPPDAQLRRAVSTAYYALFHKVLRAGADRFVGQLPTAGVGYDIIYRGFNHGRMKSVCEAVDVATLSNSTRHQLGRTAVSQDARVFASAFRALQAARLLADYHPSAEFDVDDTADHIALATTGMEAFDRIAPDERTDLLALMLTTARA